MQVDISTIVFGIERGAAIFLSALGLLCVFHALRFTDIFLAFIFALAGYICWLLTDQGAHPVVAAAGAIFLTSVVYVLFVKALYEPSQELGAQGWELLILSIGAYTVGTSTISAAFGATTLGFPDSAINIRLKVLDTQFSTISFYVIGCGLAAFGVSNFVYTKTLIGLKFRAILDDPGLSELMRINYGRLRVILYACGGALISLSGILSALDVSIFPSMGFDPILEAVLAMLLGMNLGVTGVFVSAMLLGLSLQIISEALGPNIGELCLYILLLLALLVLGKRIVYHDRA